MPLFQIDKDALQPVAQSDLNLEKRLQRLIESSLDATAELLPK